MSKRNCLLCTCLNITNIKSSFLLFKSTYSKKSESSTNLIVYRMCPFLSSSHSFNFSSCQSLQSPRNFISSHVDFCVFFWHCRHSKARRARQGQKCPAIFREVLPFLSRFFLETFKERSAIGFNF